MQSTGITRRIDELGRVVIPKEIRRQMKLQEGEEMEIFVNEESVIFKKYSEIIHFKSICTEVADNLKTSVDGTVIVASCDKVVVCKGKNFRDFIDKPIDSNLSSVFYGRKTVVFTNQNLKITPFDSNNYGVKIVCPVICGGDILGGIVVLLDDESELETKVKMTEFASNLLGNLIR